MNDITQKIRSAIDECKRRESEMTAEMMNIMPQLEKAKGIGDAVKALIARAYNDQISKMQKRIETLESELKEAEEKL